MLIELEKGFVETDEGAEVNNKNLDKINKKILEDNNFCQRNKNFAFDVSKIVAKRVKKNIKDDDKTAKEINTFEKVKTAEENIKNYEEKSKGKYKV